MKGEDMEEEAMTIMISCSPESIPQEHINTYPSWKLYENPFYSPHHHQQQQQQHLSQSSKHVRQINPPLSFFKPVMDAELEIARSQIVELKAELELERKARKKAESHSKRVIKELAEERRGRDALGSVCEELARELSLFKTGVDRMKREFEKERKMRRMAEVLREERVQMKLSEAKMFFEEKLSELEETKRMQQPDRTKASISRTEHKNKEDRTAALSNINGSDSTRFGEPENPHIKRGIKGFVEFPRVVRAVGSKSRHWGTKLECQKAQLKILLKQKSPIRSNSIIIS